MLKEKEEIENYEEKSKYLKENGWTDLWHCDNWVKKEWFGHPTINVDKAGFSTDIAYNFVKNNEKV